MNSFSEIWMLNNHSCSFNYFIDYISFVRKSYPLSSIHLIYVQIRKKCLFIYFSIFSFFLQPFLSLEKIEISFVDLQSHSNRNASLFIRAAPASGSLSKTKDESLLKCRSSTSFFNRCLSFETRSRCFRDFIGKILQKKYKSRFPWMEFQGPSQNQLHIWYFRRGDFLVLLALFIEYSFPVVLHVEDLYHDANFALWRDRI